MCCGRPLVRSVDKKFMQAYAFTALPSNPGAPHLRPGPRAGTTLHLKLEVHCWQPSEPPIILMSNRGPHLENQNDLLWVWYTCVSWVIVKKVCHEARDAAVRTECDRSRADDRDVLSQFGRAVKRSHGRWWTRRWASSNASPAKNYVGLSRAWF